jgi:hypothetical protein
MQRIYWNGDRGNLPKGVRHMQDGHGSTTYPSLIRKGTPASGFYYAFHGFLQTFANFDQSFLYMNLPHRERKIQSGNQLFHTSEQAGGMLDLVWKIWARVLYRLLRESHEEASPKSMTLKTRRQFSARRQRPWIAGGGPIDGEYMLRDLQNIFVSELLWRLVS